MAVEVIMPQMGESIFEGTITKWLKKPGDTIERDEPLFEISTDKVDAEIPSPAAGVLKEIRVEEGKTVPIQTVVALIEAPGAQAAEAAPVHAALETALPRERIYFGRYEVQPMSVMRQRIAEHMVLSKRVSPHVYSIDEADMTRIAHVREAARAEFEQKHQIKLTFMPFFVRACVDALRDFPTVNASVEGTNVVVHGEINIGIAVALDGGLIVPVLKRAEEKNFLGLQRGINDLAERARAKKLKPEDVQESTFSITNPGTFGGLMGLPIINQPNVAILGIGAIQKRPVIIDDAIAIRSMVYLTLSYDHRVVDGATAHQFMRRVKERLETWTEDVL